MRYLPLNDTPKYVRFFQHILMEEREREGEKRGRGMMEEEGIAVGKKIERRLTKEEAHLIPQNVVADNFVRGM